MSYTFVKEGRLDLSPQSLSNWGRKSVSNLAILGSLPARKLPIVRIGPTLEPRHHGNSQFGRNYAGMRRVGPRRNVSDSPSVDGQLRPGELGSARSKIRASMLLAAANQGRSDSVGQGCPLVRMGPTVFRHEVYQQGTNGRCCALRLGPVEVNRVFGEHRNEHESGSKLRHSVVC